jgi:flagellar biosynthesis/type III secretory pathway protein FliH
VTPDEIERTHRAATLLADAWGPALEREYRRGRAEGYRIGYQQAEADMAASWHAMWEKIHVTEWEQVSYPSHAEIVARRRDGTPPAEVTP